MQYGVMIREAKWTPSSAFLLVVLATMSSGQIAAAAQFTAYFPLPSDVARGTAAIRSPLPPQTEAMAAGPYGQWQAYCSVWRKHHQEPSDASVRVRLGIASDQAAVSVSSGRSAAASMRLPLMDMRRVETEHFMLLSDAPQERASQVVRDLERFYQVWTQLFFPLWKDREHWDRAEKSSRPRAAVKHRVVLFSNAARYAAVLRGVGPGVGQSSGFYSDLKRITFFHDDDGDDMATRFHEITHQLMSEATDAKPRLRPGEQRDFWIVEGIACYMESATFHEDHATVGGWQASRLQFARQRVLGLNDVMPLESLADEGRRAVQQRQDLSRWYSFAAAYTHQLADQDDGGGWTGVLQRLAQVYQINPSALAVGLEPPVPQESLNEYLHLDDEQIEPVLHDRLAALCLTRTAVTSAGLKKIASQRSLKWLDCSFLGIDSADVIRLSPRSSTIEQLSLEATRVDDLIGDWLADASQLRELDLSSCSIGDAVIAKLPRAAPIETLWLTGSRVSDSSIDTIAAMATLQRVDVQRSAVSEQGLARLRAARNDLQINPLEVASPE